MYIRELPLIGSSYNFVGAENGGVSISIFFVQAQPGTGAPLHCHERDEVIVVGHGVLRQLDIHVNPRFKQENLPATETARNAELPQ